MGITSNPELNICIGAEENTFHSPGAVTVRRIDQRFPGVATRHVGETVVHDSVQQALDDMTSHMVGEFGCKRGKSRTAGSAGTSRSRGAKTHKGGKIDAKRVTRQGVMVNADEDIAWGTSHAAVSQTDVAQGTMEGRNRSWLRVCKGQFRRSSRSLLIIRRGSLKSRGECNYVDNEWLNFFFFTRGLHSPLRLLDLLDAMVSDQLIGQD